MDYIIVLARWLVTSNNIIVRKVFLRHKFTILTGRKDR